MAKIKYVVQNGESILGLMWEAVNGREVFVMYDNKLDVNFPLEIRDSTNGNDIPDVDLIDLLSSVLPKNK